MSVSFSRQELLSLTQGNSAPTTERIVFSGIKSKAEDVRGGELVLFPPKMASAEEVRVAFSRGASIIMVDAPELDCTGLELDRIIFVKDAVSAVRELARKWRDFIQTKVVISAGALGKTMVKEISASILLRQALGNFSVGSECLEFDAYLTFCQCTENHEWLSIEASCSDAVVLKNLIHVLAPTTVVLCSLSGQPIAQIEEAVSELREADALVFDADNSALLNQIKSSAARCKKMTFSSEASSADCTLKASEGVGLDGLLVTLQLGDKEFTARVPVLGRHNARHVAAAVLASVSVYPSLPVDKIRKGLDEFSAPLVRSRLKVLRNAKKVIDESYECSPASFFAWLDLAKDLQADGARVAFILGVAETPGVFTKNFVEDARKLLLGLKPGFLILVGKVLIEAFRELPEGENLVIFGADTAIAAAHIATKLPFDILLVKGSPQLGLQKTVEILIERLGE